MGALCDRLDWPEWESSERAIFFYYCDPSTHGPETVSYGVTGSYELVCARAVTRASLRGFSFIIL